MKSTAVVTIVSNNYLHFARTLMQSVAQQLPDADRYCVIVDRDLSHAAELAGEFKTIELGSLNLPDGDDFLFQYNVLELNTAVKPWALEHLIRCGYSNVLYIDPDIVLYRPLTEVLSLLEAGSDLVLTPHLLSPVLDTRKPDELDIRRAGTYNLGFCALRGTDNMLGMLHWWQGKLQRHCIIAHDRGIFVDQSWMDLVPGLFPNVSVLRHPGYNVAYWNIAQRPVIKEGADFLVVGEPLAFFHYSGLNPLSPQPVSKHQDRFTLDNVGAAVAELIRDYCQRVINNGIEHYREVPYAFGYYDDGEAITDADRSRFRVRNELRGKASGRPFACRELLSTAEAQQQMLAEAKPPSVDGLLPDEDEKLLGRIYTHFLGRQPDDGALDASQDLTKNSSRRLRIILAVATSPEARAKPGWMLRLLSWPLQAAQLAKPSVEGVLPAPASAERLQARPAPYGGLHAPEPDSAVNGIWVASRLDLPVSPLSAGRIRINGVVDLELLARGRPNKEFKLEIHGPLCRLRSETIAQSGPFVLDLTIPRESFAVGSQWTILASSHIVPKDIALGEDTRELAWRVNRVEVDGLVLVDSTRSPVTQAIDRLVPAGGINLVGYLAAELGIGEAARSLARACVAAKIPFSAVDVGYQSQNLQRDTALLDHAVTDRFPIDMLYVNADQTAVTSAYLQSKGLQSRYRIGYWHWEQPQLPPSALGAFAHVDEVWVPSTFVHDAVAPYSPVPVVKIPHALQFAPTPGLVRSQFGLPENKVLVLVMYDFHSYQYRKNPQAALAAFRKAAASRTDVVLVIKTINGQHHAEARQTLQESVSDLGNILFIDEFYTRQQTWDLQACCDILLSLHRAEGFGLAPAEMMYLGKPVIATGWSANMDFMTSENSFPVRYRLQPLVEAVGVYPAGQLWAEADIEHAAACLVSLLDDPQLRREMGERAARDVREKLSPQAVGELVRQRLSLLHYWNPLR